MAPLAWVLLLAAALPQPRLLWDGPGATHLGSPSPDGRYLTGVDPDSGDLILRDLASQSTRKLTGKPVRSREFAYFSVVSRDSRTVAYAWFNTEGFYELRIIPINGGAPRTLYRNEEAGFVQPTAFSHDGKSIVTLLFRRDNISQIALIDSATGAAKILKSLNWIYPKRMDISPDGRTLVYDSFSRDGAADRDIYLLSLDGAREIKLTTGPAEDVFPLFDLTGKRVFFSSDRSGAPALFSTTIHDPQPVLVLDKLGRFLPLAIRTPGDLVYATRTGGSHIYQATLDTAARRLTELPQAVGEGWSPVWSPDGRTLAWLGRRAGENFGTDSRFVATRDTSTGANKIYDTHLAHMERLAFRNAGLLISGSDGKGRGGLFQLDPANDTARPLTRDHAAPHRGFPAAGPFWANGNQIFKGDQPVFTLPAEILTLAVSAKNRIAAATGKGLYVDAKPILTSPVNAVIWHPDNEHLLYSGHDGLFLLHLPSLTATRLLQTTDPVDSLTLHPDGRQLLFASGRARTQIWAVQP
ncbi:MAG: PD40 domain-containing protein [Bryobacterales bacterium]|nr:PD40 domain-containing protein [Bryobacterales bacterium]